MMTPVPAPSPGTDDEDATISVADRAAGKTRLLSAPCQTCVFRPGDPTSLSPGRLHDLVDQARARGTFIIRHETLPYAPVVKRAELHSMQRRMSPVR